MEWSMPKSYSNSFSHQRGWGTIGKKSRMPPLRARGTNAMSSEIESLKLWEVLKAKGTIDQQKLVRDLADDASAILNLVIETFPTYTLHNATHARNVAGLMADLLGPR